MGSREGVAAKIDAETKVKIEEMNRTVQSQKSLVWLLFFIKKKNFWFVYTYIS